MTEQATGEGIDKEEDGESPTKLQEETSSENPTELQEETSSENPTELQEETSSESINNLIGETIKKQNDNIERLVKGLTGLAKKSEDFDQRLDNLEQLICDIGNAVKSLASGGAQKPVSASGQGKGILQGLYDELGPLAEPVISAVQPEDPMKKLYKAWIDAQIKDLEGGRQPSETEKIGSKVLEKFAERGVDQMFGSGGLDDAYQRKYWEEKAKHDAKGGKGPTRPRG